MQLAASPLARSVRLFRPCVLARNTPISCRAYSSSPSSPSSSSQTFNDLKQSFIANSKNYYNLANTRLKNLGLHDRLSKLSSQFNEYSGYTDIETLKADVVLKESALRHARNNAKVAKSTYENAVAAKLASQRHLNELMQRKAHWTDSDVSQFPEIVRQDHLNDTAEKEAKEALEASEEVVEKRFSELMRAILSRYHEEQIWSEKMRSLSTYGSIAITATNVLVFLLALLIIEPWRRKKMVERIEKRMSERESERDSQLQSSLAALNDRFEKLEVKMIQTSEHDYNNKTMNLVDDDNNEQQQLDTESPSPSSSNNYKFHTQLEYIQQWRETHSQEEAIVAAGAGGVAFGALVVGLLAAAFR